MSDGGKKLEAKGKARKVQGKARDGLGDVQGRGRLRPIVVSAAVVAVVAGLLTGVLHVARDPG